MRRLGLVVLALALGLGLAACGGRASTTPPSHPVTAVPYVALGDSYSAAPGVPATDLADGCFRSSHNYPHLLAAAVPGVQLRDVTCSAAMTASLTNSQEIEQVSVPAQFSALTRSTRYVTLGIGGNDFGLFSTILGSCLGGSGGCATRLGPSVAHDLTAIGTRVTQALKEIHRRSPSAKVALVGYPQLVPASGSCPQLPLTPGDQTFVHQLMIDLSTKLAAAAAAGEAAYVDLTGPSEGHDICSSSPWINGATTNNQALEFHPYLAEQQAVAELAAKALGVG